MASSVVTDPELLAKLNAPEPKTDSKGIVTDPALLAVLNGEAHPLVAAHADMAAEPAEPKSTLQTVREAIHAPTRALENGAFLGLGDRARAAIDSVLSGFSGYGQHLKNEQAATEDFHNAHPIADTALGAVGGVLAPAAVVGAVGKGGAALATRLGIGELGAKTLVGGGTGAAIGATQGALGSRDWTDLPQVAKDTGVGGLSGLAIGATMPSAAKAGGALYNSAANLVRGGVEGMSRKAAAPLLRAVQADGPAVVQARLAELGPDATMADAGPALLGKLQGASLNSDEGRSIAQTALTARNAGTNARIQSDVNRALGPAEDPQTVTNAIRAHRSAVDAVNYPAALDNAPPVQTAHILTQLDDMIPRSLDMEKKALTNLRNNLMTTEQRPRLNAAGKQEVNPNTGQPIFDEVPVSQNDANMLHKAKVVLDNVIQYDAPGLGVPAGALKTQQGALKYMRGQLNDALEHQVPGYAAANDVSAALAKRAEAVEKGTQYLGNGKTTPSPERFASEFEPLSQGEKIAFAKGSRGNIDRVLGTKANDLQALRGELQGEGGWNTDKIATVHGVPAANDLVNTVDRNLKFRDTYNKVVENSQTAQRNAAAKEMKPDPSTETPFFNPNSTLYGNVATVGKKAVMGVVNALSHVDPTRSYGEVARALTEQGAARDARLMAVVKALDARQGNAAASETAGKVGSVVAALLGKGAVDELRANPKQRQQP